MVKIDCALMEAKLLRLTNLLGSQPVTSSVRDGDERVDARQEPAAGDRGRDAALRRVRQPGPRLIRKLVLIDEPPIEIARKLRALAERTIRPEGEGPTSKR